MKPVQMRLLSMQNWSISAYNYFHNVELRINLQNISVTYQCTLHATGPFARNFLYFIVNVVQLSYQSWLVISISGYRSFTESDGCDLRSQSVFYKFLNRCQTFSSPDPSLLPRMVARQLPRTNYKSDYLVFYFFFC